MANLVMINVERKNAEAWMKWQLKGRRTSPAEYKVKVILPARAIKSSTLRITAPELLQKHKLRLMEQLKG